MRDLKADLEGLQKNQSEWSELPKKIIVEYIERAIKAEEEMEKQQQLFTAQTDRNVEIIKRLNERKREVCEANDLLSARVAGYRNILKVIHAGCTPFLKTSDLAKDIAYACYKALSNPDPGADLLAKIEKLEAGTRLIETDMGLYYQDFAWKCDNCSEVWTLVEGTPEDNLYKYCPNCGAKIIEYVPYIEGPADE